VVRGQWLFSSRTTSAGKVREAVRQTLSLTIGSTTQEQDGLVVIITPTYQTRRHIPEHMVRTLLAASDWRSRVIMSVMLPSFFRV
jgi:hypothetical protein